MIKKLIIEKAERLQKLPPTPFVEAKRVKQGLIRRGVEVIDLGELDPDPSLRDYFFPPFEGSEVFALSDSRIWQELKQKIGKWLEQRYDLKTKSEREILPFFGEKKGIYYLLLSLINPGEVVSVPDPGEPIYKIASVLAGAEVEAFPLLERNDYLPNLSVFLSSRRAGSLPKIFFLNYPHNPTSSVADSAFFQEVVEWAGKKNVLVINDASGNEICYDDHLPVSLLQTKSAKKLAVERFSFFALTGIQFGFLVGDRGIISQVESVQEALGETVSKASVLQALEILKNHPQIVQKNNLEFAVRKDTLLKGLFNLGWKAKKPKAGPFVWVKIPPRYSSVGFFRMLLRKAGVLVSPGFGFGEYGEGYIRIALNLPADQIQKALERIERHSHIWQRRYRPKNLMTND
ncbi:MAG: aminotransferase class I/II-fold pyridoxal phosphate-dependent enzyme [candidate division Zixibacteria bacterium]|nr:aminotransferase class I/II-fold pyridoxal phosphate-dependent enzyme [candidate division Zixibacteria bacterium]